MDKLSGIEKRRGTLVRLARRKSFTNDRRWLPTAHHLLIRINWDGIGLDHSFSSRITQQKDEQIRHHFRCRSHRFSSGNISINSIQQHTFN